MPKSSHHYEVHLTWSGSNGVGTTSYSAYSRAHTLNARGKPPIFGSSDPQFRGDAACWNPEELLVASLSACHQLWYLHLCANAGVTVLAYEDRAEGVLRLHADGSGEFANVVLRPQVTIAAGCDGEKAISLHHDAGERCFIARSMRFPVNHEPSISFMDGPKLP